MVSLHASSAADPRPAWRCASHTTAQFATQRGMRCTCRVICLRPIRCVGVSAAVGEDAQQCADLEVVFQGMPKREVRVDLVAVPSADLLVREVPGVLELGHDPLSSALGDADLRCYLSHENVRILLDAEQDVGVIREERPTVWLWHAGNHTSSNT